MNALATSSECSERNSELPEDLMEDPKHRFESEKASESERMAIVRVLHATETSNTEKSAGRPTVSENSENGGASDQKSHNLRKKLKCAVSDEFGRQYSFGKHAHQAAGEDYTQHHSHVSFKPTDYVASPKQDCRINEFRHGRDQTESDLEKESPPSWISLANLRYQLEERPDSHTRNVQQRYSSSFMDYHHRSENSPLKMEPQIDDQPLASGSTHEIQLIEEQQQVTDSSREPEPQTKRIDLTSDEQGQSPSERHPHLTDSTLEKLQLRHQRSYFKKLQLQVDEQMGESHSSSDTILEKDVTNTKNATNALFTEKSGRTEETPSDTRHMQIQFENSSKNSEQIAPMGFKKTAEQVNLIDKLLSERDSQFSNFNDKIQRLRHGHSNSSFKDQRRSAATFNDTIGYHSTNSKPKLQKVAEINWGKQARFVLSAKNQSQRKDSHTLLNAISRKKDEQRFDHLKTTLINGDPTVRDSRRNQKQNYSFLASNTNHQIKQLMSRQGRGHSSGLRQLEVDNERTLSRLKHPQQQANLTSARHRQNRGNSVGTEDSNWHQSLLLGGSTNYSHLVQYPTSNYGTRQNYLSRQKIPSQTPKMSEAPQPSRLIPQSRYCRSKSPRGDFHHLSDTQSLMGAPSANGDQRQHLQRSFKILSLLDGTSSLNQALQMNQSGGNLIRTETPPMRLVPNNPTQLLGPSDHHDFAPDSTWRSIALQKQMAANTDEDKEPDAKLTLDDLGGTRTGVTAEYGRDMGSHSADRIVIPPTGGPGSAYGQYSSLEASMSQEKHAAMIEDLRSKWDQTQQEHRKELNSLKSTFVDKQEELVQHFVGLIQRQEEENKSVISHLVARCEQLEEIAQRLQGSEPKTINESRASSFTDKTQLIETLRQRHTRLSKPILPKDPSTGRGTVRTQPPQTSEIQTNSTINFLEEMSKSRPPLSSFRGIQALEEQADDEQSQTHMSSIGYVVTSRSISTNHPSKGKDRRSAQQSSWQTTPMQGQGTSGRRSAATASKQFANLMTRMPPKKVRLLMAKSSPRLAPPSAFQSNSQNQLAKSPNYLLTQIEKQYATGHFRSSQHESEGSEADNRLSIASQVQNESLQLRNQAPSSLGPRLFQMKPQTGYPLVHQKGEICQETNTNVRQRDSSQGLAINMATSQGATAAGITIDRRETTLPESPLSENSPQPQYYAPVLVQLVPDAGGQRVDTAEDCEVRDEDEEQHNSVINVGPSSRLLSDSLAIRSSKQASPSRSQHTGNASFKGQPPQNIYTVHRRQSSGIVSRKMVANETIRPLPTSFALQEQDPIDMQVFEFAHKALEVPTMHGPKVMEQSEVTQFMYSQTEQSMLLLENSMTQKNSIAPSTSFERRSSLARFANWHPDNENIVSERSHKDNQSVPNYQNVQRNTLVFQPVKHKQGPLQQGPIH